MGLRLGQAVAGVAQRRAIRRTVKQEQRLLQQLRLGRISFGQPPARAAFGKPAGVGGLMVVGGVGPRNGDRRYPERHQLAQRRAAGPRDRNVGGPHPQADVRRVVDDGAVGLRVLALQALRVPTGDDGQMGVSIPKGIASRQQRVVDRAGPIRAAQREHQRTIAGYAELRLGLLWRSSTQTANGVAQRHAHHRRAGRVQALGGIGEAQEDAIDPRRQQPRHQARPDVLFVNHRRDAQQRRAQNGRKRRVAARPNHDAWTDAAQERQGLREAEDVRPERRHGRHGELAQHAARVDGMALHVGPIQQNSGLQAPRRSDVPDGQSVTVAPTERLDQRQRGIEVPSGPAAGDQDGHTMLLPTYSLLERC